MFSKIPILISMMFPFSSFAETGCDNSDIHSMQLPVYAQTESSSKFKYNYRIQPGVKGAPVIYVLGGGPGQNTIALGAAPILGAFPKEYTLVYTDPRSVGCNNTYPFQEDALSTLALADDVASLVENLQHDQFPGQPYYIYGASFGTQHTTILAKRLQQRKIQLPQAVILEGVSGHHYSSFNDYFQHFKSEWERIKNEDLKIEVRNFFESPLPTNSSELGYASKVWGQFVSLQIILGYIPQGGKRFQHLIDWYLTDENGKTSAVTQLSNLAIATNDGAQVPVEKLFQVIGCREIWGEFFTGRDIVNGQLMATGEDVCKGTQLDQPYDSKLWQIPVPIFYFQGIHDPTTTLEQATYHFDNQSSDRQMIVVERASHAPLSVALRPCANQIWQAITSSPDSLKTVAEACGQALGTKIEHTRKSN